MQEQYACVTQIKWHQIHGHVEMKTDHINHFRQMQGSILLEGLIAILVFSMGVLALLGMQVNSIGAISEAKYRTDATFLANQLIGNMWANAPANPTDANGVPLFSPPCPASPLTSYAYAGAGVAPAVLSSWIQSVNATLPDAAAFPPVVTVVGSALTSNPGNTCGMQYTVTITLRYRPPRNTAPHRFVTTAIIS